MTAKPYLITTGVWFALQTVGQLAQVALGVPIEIGEMSIPLWPSSIGLFVTLLLCVWAFRLAGRQPRRTPAADKTD